MRLTEPRAEPTGKAGARHRGHRAPGSALSVLASIALATAGGLASATQQQVAPVDSTHVLLRAPDPNMPGSLVGPIVHGREYGDLWSHRATIPILDLAKFAGGLTARPTARDSSARSLHFRGADGRDYIFYRLPRTAPAARDLGQRLVNLDDTERSAHPAAPVIASALEDAAGLLHAHPTLFILPDDPGLGEARASFAGRFGILEESVPFAGDSTRGADPTRAADSTLGADSVTVLACTRAVLDSLLANPANHLDARAFLAARLVDFVLGDLEEGAQDWEWIGSRDGVRTVWKPIAPDAGRRLSRPGRFAPLMVLIGESGRRTTRLRDFASMDRELLAGLDGQAWDSVATAIRSRLPDSVVVHAVATMPAEMRAASAAAVTRALERRRDGLRQFARYYYARLSSAVNLRMTETAELALVDRLDGRHMQVSLWPIDAHGATADSPCMLRRFDRRETNEVRIHLLGGEDRVVVRGRGRGAVLLRIVNDGSGGALVDSSRAGGVRLYDSGHEVQVSGSNRVDLDARPYRVGETPAPAADLEAGASPDYGRSAGFSSWRGVDAWGGFFLGGQYTEERFGFRQPRFASRTTLRAGYSPLLGGVQFEASREEHRANSGLFGALRVRASNSDRVRFYGLSNAGPAPLPRMEYLYRFRQSELELTPSLGWDASRRVTLTAGVPFKLVRMDQSASGDSVRALNLIGWGSRRQLGAQLGVAYRHAHASDRSRGPEAAGEQASLTGTYYVRGNGLTGGYASLDASSGYRAVLSGAAAPALALYAGGKALWGPHPFDEAALLGGRSGLPGLPVQQYAGDAAVFVQGEERVRLKRVHRLVGGDFGVLVLEETGRVFVRGEESTLWHTAAGPGVWFTPSATRSRLMLGFVRGERHTGLFFRGALGF